jgi:lipoate-protein ligase A
MLFVDNAAVTDPRLNLAIEEHLLRNIDVAEPLLLFYVNEPAVIVGRNQNTVEEIDPDFIQAENIHVVRRLSGGGAVYHDLGNLNFSFVTQGKQDLHNFAKFTGPVIEVLRELGVDAELKGKSDIFAAGKKISGNAQYAAGGRMFSHGTLLFDTDIEAMLRALNPGQVEIESKAVQSVRNFVINLRELLPQDIDIDALRQAILRGAFGEGPIPEYDLTDSDWEVIRQISAQRYALWEWNFGHSPKFNVQKSERFPAGVIDVRIEVEGGRIENIRFFGNFAGLRDVGELEEQLLGVRYDGSALSAVLNRINIQPYFGELSKAELLKLLY